MEDHETEEAAGMSAKLSSNPSKNLKQPAKRMKGEVSKRPKTSECGSTRAFGHCFHQRLKSYSFLKFPYSNGAASI